LPLLEAWLQSPQPARELVGVPSQEAVCPVLVMPVLVLFMMLAAGAVTPVPAAVSFR
jgi:hypothetical protein